MVLDKLVIDQACTLYKRRGCLAVNYSRSDSVKFNGVSNATDPFGRTVRR